MTPAQEMRGLWFNASPGNFKASLRRAKEIQAAHPDDRDVAGYMEGLLNAGATFGLL